MIPTAKELKTILQDIWASKDLDCQHPLYLNCWIWAEPTISSELVYPIAIKGEQENDLV